MLYRRVVVVLIAFGIGCEVLPNAFAQALDVNGVRLGMTLDEAKARIGNGYQVRIDKFTDPAMALLSAASPNNAAAGDGWEVEAINGKVVYIEHQRFFPDGAQPERSTVEKQLEQKYGGPPTNVFNGFPEWMYDNRTLIQSASRQLQQRCGGQPNPMAKSPLGILTNYGKTAGLLYFPASVRPGCPIHVFVRPQGGALLAGIDVSLFDEQAIYDEANAVARAKAAQQQQQIENGKKVSTPF